MKTLLGILLLASVVFFTACEIVGPEGPPGPSGKNGENGLIGTIFEIKGNLTADNKYSLVTKYPENLKVYQTDIVLVYILWERVDDNDVWRLLPQTVVVNEGVIMYNYDYTLNDVRVFMEFTVDQNSLRPAETDNQVFRIAVLPAKSAQLKSIDISNYNSIIKSPDIQLKPIQQLDIENIAPIK